jgi:energy-coupling factor transport system permease protein
MRDIAFGQYYPASSFVHKTDPRTKLFAAVIFIAAVFLCDVFYSYLACYAFLFIVIAVSRVPLGSILKTVKSIIVIVVITVILNLFFYKQGNKLFSWWVFTVTDEGLIYAAKMALRIIFLVVSTSMVTFTATPTALTDGLENVMTPLKWIKFPVRDVAVIMSIALRFIPTLTEEVDKIIMAQKARGAHFDNGGVIKRAKAMLPILVPLFVSTFRRADELAMALDSRCYNATPDRTKMKPLRYGWRDLVAFLILAAFLALVIMMKLGLFGLLGGAL